MVLSEGDTGFIMFATTLVMLQIPGIGLFQAGLIRRKNALSILMQIFFGYSIGALLWFVFGFSAVFGDTVLYVSDSKEKAYSVIGNPFEYFCFRGLKTDEPYSLSSDTGHSIDDSPASKISAVEFAMFQQMFSAQAPIIISGSWVEKMTMQAFVLFTIMWTILVYYPICHWVWNLDGWLHQLGVADFAGGLVIHTNTGISAFAVCLFLKKRAEYTKLTKAYHNLPLSMIGATFIWAGWYSFNAGSAFSAGSDSMVAFANTHFAACAGSLLWLLLDWRASNYEHFSLVSFGNGCFAGLAAVTPGSGYIPLYWSPLVGAFGSLAAYKFTEFLETTTIEDVLGVVALQGITGALGTIMVAFFADDDAIPERGLLYCSDVDPSKGEWCGIQFLGLQILGVIVVCIYAGGMTACIMWLMHRKLLKGMVDVDVVTEMKGLDVVQIGEIAYKKDEVDQHLNYHLYEACRAGNYVETLSLLMQNADLNARDYDQRTPLHLACANSHAYVVELLVKGGAKIDVEDRWMAHPIDDAYNPKVVEILRKAGSPPQRRNQIYRLLGAAAEGNVELIKTLLNGGIPANVIDYDGRTAMHLAICNAQEEVVKLLLERVEGKRCIYSRDRSGRNPKEECRRVLKHTHFGKRNKVALKNIDSMLTACAVNSLPLLPESPDASKSGVSDFFNPADSGFLPFNTSGLFKKSGNCTPGNNFTSGKSTCNKLDDSGATCNGMVDGGMEAVNSVRLDKSSSTNSRTSNSQANSGCVTPKSSYEHKSWSRKSSNESNNLEEPLLGHSSRTSSDGSGRLHFSTAAPGKSRLEHCDSPDPDKSLSFFNHENLFEASASNDIAKLELLLDKGYDIDTTDYDERSLLHVACSFGSYDQAKMLIDRGINVNAIDMKGSTPLYDAIKYCYSEDKGKVTRQGRIVVRKLSTTDFSEKPLKPDILSRTNSDRGDTLLESDDCEETRRALLRRYRQDKGATNIKDKYEISETTLTKDKYKLLRLLHKHGAVVSSGITGALLCDAAAHGDLTFLKHALENGDDLDIGDYDCRTALHLACCTGQYEATVWLLERAKCDLKCRDRWGVTPRVEAQRNGHQRIVHFIDEFVTSMHSPTSEGSPHLLCSAKKCEKLTSC